jgi:DNA-binding FadR family transcriptional regulator
LKTRSGPLDAALPRSIHARIAHDLGIAIVGGALPPGHLVPGEERYSADNGVSRSAYREAVKTLAAKGLVHSRTKSGTRVSDRAGWNMLDLDVLAWMFEAGPSRDFVQGVFELRRIVEPQAAALAALRRDEREVARMGHALEEMARFGLMHVDGRAADERFHALLLQATRNEPLVALSSSIAAAVKWTTRLAREERGQNRDPMPDHYAVYRAVVERDADRAQAAMARLVENATRDAESPISPTE